MGVVGSSTGNDDHGTKPTPNNKSIVLFSDGTGNSSAKLFKTNVWRVYEAVDLGPAAKEKRPQIAFYDDGVGTSSFKPLAILGGALGYGLKRNVLDLYRYACRNYKPGEGQQPNVGTAEEGDHVYGFGFSRGAFTMRIVIALIASQGLIVTTDERELRMRSKQAYRKFRAEFLPRRWQLPTKLARRVRDWVLGFFNEPYSSDDNYKPVIKFVGVWDTVAAYGGPFVEVTRAIDNWIFPLSMPDYTLSDRVQCARHALALDDERDSFHPLLWDEVHEANRIAAVADTTADSGDTPHWITANRLQQVWFTGMHSDVGGGYPDESLSYVSLLWMLEEAREAGLRTIDGIIQRYRDLANSFGPVHDSRVGMGAYYRYQPRRLAVWTNPVEECTLAMRDPTVTDRKLSSDPAPVSNSLVALPRGLLRTVRVHESVVARVASGTDRYAPIGLPKEFDIVPPQTDGEVRGRGPLVSPELRRTVRDPDLAAARVAAMEDVWNTVWLRRISYFVTVLLTLILASMPAWQHAAQWQPLLLSGAWLGKPIRLLSPLVPQFADRWIETYASHPFYFYLLAALIAASNAVANSLELRLRDRARRIWKSTLAAHPESASARQSWLAGFRNGGTYQQSVKLLKWTFLPIAAGGSMAFLGLWLTAALFTQARIPYLETRDPLCKRSVGTPEGVESETFAFDTRSLCLPLNKTVEAGHRYVFTFDVVENWQDGSKPTNPAGLPASHLGLVGYLLAPFRRVLDANYLQPVLQIRTRATDPDKDYVVNYPLDVTSSDGARLYRAEFIAPRSGEAAVFVNDAVVPVRPTGQLDARYFYESGPNGRARNQGTANLTVEHASGAARASAD